MKYPFTYLAAILAVFTLGACSGDTTTSTRSPDHDSQQTNSHDHDGHDDHDGEHADHDHDADDHADHDAELQSDHDDHAHRDAASDPRHDDHDEHDDDTHAGHDHGEEDHSDHVELTPDQAAEAGIIVTRAELAPLAQTVSLPAELRFDADRVAAVAPQVSGRIISLAATEGDIVRRGATLAVLSSRELADLKAEYLSLATAADLARQALTREETLFADRITSEADLQAARAALTAARANLSGVENKLHAVGISDRELDGLSNAPDGSLANVSLTAPIGGVIARRTATVGAAVSSDDPGASALFTIVDDSVLWADIAVYQQNASAVQPGAQVTLKSQSGVTLAESQIAIVLPSIDETSRTATARMIVENPDKRLRPGQFATAEIMSGSGRPRLQVPSAAIVSVEGRLSIFVPTEDGFEPRSVSIGAEVGGHTVVQSGLREGEAYVSAGAFTLKAQLEKDAFGDGHVH